MFLFKNQMRITYYIILSCGIMVSRAIHALRSRSIKETYLCILWESIMSVVCENRTANG